MPALWRLIGWGLAAALFCASAVMVFGTYSRVEVVQGALTLDSGIATIVPSRAGVVEQVFVKEGSRVVKGAPLVTVRTAEDQVGGTTTPERLKAVLSTQAQQYAAQESFLSAASKANLAQMEQEARGLESELRNIESQMAEQRRLLELAEANLERAEAVVSRGFISRRDLERIEELASTRRQQLSQMEQRAIATRSDIAEIERSAAEAAASTAGQIEAVRIGRNSIEKELADAEQREGYVLTAPFGGLVTATVARVGQEAAAGRHLMLLMPEGATLQAELQLPSKAAGLVEQGQRVRLAIDAFPSNTFGTVVGKIREVSRAAYQISGSGGQPPSYRAVVDLDRNYIDAFGERQPLLPGMTVTARIVTQEQSLLQRLFEPIYAVGRR
jgi:membrane fusion protein